MPIYQGKVWEPLTARVRVCLRHRRVFYKDGWCRLPPRFFELFLYVYYHGPVEVEQIFEWMFYHDSDGGPIQGHKHVDVYYCLMNKKLAHAGIAVRATRQGWREIVQV